MTENQQKVIGQALMYFSKDTPVTEDALNNCVNVYSMLCPLTDEEKKEVIRELQSRLAVKIDRGVCIREKNHTPWYNAAKKTITSSFWSRYCAYLQKEQGWNNNLLNELDRSSDEIMDLLGNPGQSEGFQRRGLCIGDVQSGKTSNYIGLINKAADAGYKVIILLTGVIEKLRRQTQARIDTGFIGLDSTAFTRDKITNAWVGVGCIDPSVSGWAVTSTSGDFNAATANNVVGQLKSFNDPVIFVLKKNKSVLEKLEKWLGFYNVDKSINKIDLPMLLIDDEADNASVNTREIENPTAINADIRKLIRLFAKANYVGFTATPYANIFIDPDSETEMLENDLFPKNFIYALEAPSNYIGARDIFQENAPYAYLLKSNDDCEQYLPIKHKNESVLSELPPSLYEAIASFFIVNAVRDLRGQEKTHRTMMINMSRFISVQNKIFDKVDAFVRNAQREIQNYYLLGGKALEYDTFKMLKDTFEKHFMAIPDFEFSWKDIQPALKNAVMPVTVRVINGGNAPKNLNYDDVKEDGLRLIAVGGMSLSRGLTLEGLCISYFYRNSMMYDTLMQMGRWFGYRKGYEDICQIWMPDSAVAWYSYISEASDELRNEISRMQRANRTPEDFGLCVRNDITALLVTARNKMKSAQEYQMTVSLSGRVVETPYLHSNPVRLQDNAELVVKFLEKLHDKYKLHKDDPTLALKTPQYLNVEKSDVLDFLNMYSSHSMNIDFHTDELVQLIKNDDEAMNFWDVTIATGTGETVDFPGFQIKPVKRSFSIREEKEGALQMSGKNSRLGSRDLAKGGLTKEAAVEIENKENDYIDSNKALSQSAYFKSGIKRNPLLVIYPVELAVKNDDPDNIRKQKMIDAIPVPVIGLSIGIPVIDGKEPQKFTYKINMIKYRELFGVDDMDGDEFEETDETVAEDDR